MNGFLEWGFTVITITSQLCWFLIKLTIGYIILTGGLISLGMEVPFFSISSQYSEVIMGQDIIPIGKKIYDKWYGLLFLVLFIWFIQMRRKINLLERHIEQTKLFNVTLLNYLEIVPKTEGQMEMKDKGIIRYAIDSLFEKIVFSLLGMTEAADAILKAKATRNDRDVNIFDDINKRKKNSFDDVE
jgi:hypothetical protein